jgi:predicted nucleotidyltransferase component of viral defense system
MQLNALVRNLAREKNIGAEIILRNYMLERLLERIALSAYSHNFILKGGMLIAAMVGLDTRTTMDLDATIRGQDLTEAEITALFQKIIAVEVDDHVMFSFKKIEEIREEAEYPGYRVSFEARLDSTRQTLKVDITTGDSITPREVEYRFKLMFEDRTISVLAYNLETVLAEKMEGILIRGVTNTRMRDYYDVYILTAMQSENIDRDVFDKALRNTAEKRGSGAVLPKAQEIIRTVELNETIQRLWKQYQKNYSYAADIPWDMVVRAVKSLAPSNTPANETPHEIKSQSRNLER